MLLKYFLSPATNFVKAFREHGVNTTSIPQECCCDEHYEVDSYLLMDTENASDVLKPVNSQTHPLCCQTILDALATRLA